MSDRRVVSRRRRRAETVLPVLQQPESAAAKFQSIGVTMARLASEQFAASYCQQAMTLRKPAAEISEGARTLGDVVNNTFQMAFLIGGTETMRALLGDKTFESNMTGEAIYNAMDRRVRDRLLPAAAGEKVFLVYGCFRPCALVEDPPALVIDGPNDSLQFALPVMASDPEAARAIAAQILRAFDGVEMGNVMRFDGEGGL